MPFPRGARYVFPQMSSAPAVKSVLEPLYHGADLHLLVPKKEPDSPGYEASEEDEESSSADIVTTSGGPLRCKRAASPARDWASSLSSDTARMAGETTEEQLREREHIKQLEIKIMRGKGYRCLVCDEAGMWKCAECGGEPPIIDKEYIRMGDGWIQRKVHSVTQSTCDCFPDIAEENKVEV